MSAKKDKVFDNRPVIREAEQLRLYRLAMLGQDGKLSVTAYSSRAKPAAWTYANEAAVVGR